MDSVSLSGLDVATLLQKAELDGSALAGHCPQDQRLGLGPVCLLVLLSPLSLSLCPMSAPVSLNPKDCIVIQKHDLK